jgi:hypothetical protein
MPEQIGSIDIIREYSYSYITGGQFKIYSLVAYFFPYYAGLYSFISIVYLIVLIQSDDYDNFMHTRYKCANYVENTFFAIILIPFINVLVSSLVSFGLYRSNYKLFDYEN